LAIKNAPMLRAVSTLGVVVVAAFVQGCSLSSSQQSEQVQDTGGGTYSVGVGKTWLEGQAPAWRPGPVGLGLGTCQLDFGLMTLLKVAHDRLYRQGWLQARLTRT